MLFSIAALALSALAAPALAQSQDHQVMVGAGGLLQFSPPSINATAGDTITFVFNPKNHTVTQSTFAAPCTKMAGGIASGFQPVAANSTQVPAMTITVNDTTPLWFYCGQTNPVSHCSKGMVFAVNAGSETKTFTQFQAAANATGTNSTSSTTGSSGSSGTSGSSGSSGSSGTSGTSGTSGGSSPSPSASTTSGSASGALGLTARSAPVVLAALGVAAGLLL